MTEKKRSDKTVNSSALFLAAYDKFIDYMICRRSISVYIPTTSDKESGIGATGTDSTHYITLNEIFSHVNITEKDSFIDIGCGTGRTLAFLLHKKAPCKICGVEFREKPAKIASEWAKRYDNVNVIYGDAFKIDFNNYNVFFLNRPFLPKTFMQFIMLLEQNLNHTVTFIYWVDQQSGFFLKNRSGWKMLYREMIFKLKGIQVAPVPQGFSVWTFNPAERKIQE